MPPNVPNGIITYYSIERSGTNIGNFSSNELMYTIEGLSPDTVYTLQLRAHTGAGPGLPSNVTFVTCKLNVLHINISSIVNVYTHIRTYTIYVHIYVYLTV